MRFLKNSSHLTNHFKIDLYWNCFVRFDFGNLRLFTTSYFYGISKTNNLLTKLTFKYQQVEESRQQYCGRRHRRKHFHNHTQEIVTNRLTKCTVSRISTESWGLTVITIHFTQSSRDEENVSFLTVRYKTEIASVADGERETQYVWRLVGFGRTQHTDWLDIRSVWREQLLGVRRGGGRSHLPTHPPCWPNNALQLSLYITSTVSECIIYCRYLRAPY